MHWIALLAACLALMLVKLFRAPDRSRIVSGSLWFATAFIVMTFGIRVVSEQAHITRPTDYDKFVNFAAEQVREEPDAPLVVFVGASYSRNALDDQALTRDLRAKGYPHRVINLSLEGASLQERDAYLWQFMRQVKRAPDAVFLEVSDEFDRDPTYAFENSKFSDRAIEQFDPSAVFWAAKGLMQGQCDGLSGCVKSWVLLKAHAFMNWTNLGMLATGQTSQDIAPNASFDPQDIPRTSFTLDNEAIRLDLGPSGEIVPENGPSWARLFRINQRARLQAAGVRRIAYYYPPVLRGADRQYVADLCAGELADYPCIAPTDQALLSNLNGQVWFDDQHLLRDGAVVYTGWLAGQIENWGALQ